MTAETDFQMFLICDVQADDDCIVSHEPVEHNDTLVEPGQTLNAMLMRRILKREGWSRQRRNGQVLDVCPKCRSKS